MNQRNYSIDAIKGYGMLWVIAGHMNYTMIGNTFFTMVYSFHMPLFFFLSGYLFKRKIEMNYFSFIKKKAKTLLLPYSYFFLISAFYGYVIRPILTQSHFPSFDFTLFAKAFLLSGGSLTEILLYNFPLWFIPFLFIAELMFYWVVKINNKAIIGILFIGLVLVTESFQAYVLGRPPFHFNVLPVALSFMILGWFSKDILPKCTWGKKTNAALLLLAVFLSSKNMGAHVAKVNNAYLYTLVALLFIVVIFNVMNQFEKENFFSYIGRNNLVLLGIHALVINVYYVTNLRAYFTNYNGIVQFMVDYGFILLTLLVILDCRAKFKEMRRRKNEKIHKINAS